MSSFVDVVVAASNRMTVSASAVSSGSYHFVTTPGEAPTGFTEVAASTDSAISAVGYPRVIRITSVLGLLTYTQAPALVATTEDIADVADDLVALASDVDDLTDVVSDHTTDISDLDARVTILE